MWRRLHALRRGRPTMLYGGALALAIAAFLLRLALHPVFGTSMPFTVFYPAVILAAYLFGAGPAALALALSTVLGYWCFAEPAFGWKASPGVITPLLFFEVTATFCIAVIDGLFRSLSEQAIARGQAEIRALDHADLFRELNARVVNHMQLLAGVLSKRAGSEPDPDVARVLSDVSARTLVIARAQRELADGGRGQVNMALFARQLVEAALAAHGGGGLRIELEGDGMAVDVDQATSLGVVLLECVNARLALGAPGRLRVHLTTDVRGAWLRVSDVGAGGHVSAPMLREIYLVEAMVEQMGGRLAVRREARGAVLELLLPSKAAGATVKAHALAPTLH